MVEPHNCDNLSQIYRLFHFSQNIFEKRYLECLGKSSGKPKNDFFCTFINYTLLVFKSSALFFNVSCYNLYMTHVSQECRGGGHFHTD